MTTELARQVAKEIAGLLVHTRTAIAYERPETPMTLADVLCLGAVVAVSIDAYAKKTPGDSPHGQLDSVSKLMNLGAAAQPELEERFFQAFINGVMTPEQMRGVITLVIGVLSNPSRLRSILSEVADDIAPPAGPGPVPKLPIGAEEAIAELANQMLPATTLLLQLRAVVPSKSVGELIDVLANDHMCEAVRLVQYSLAIEAALAAREFENLKGDSAKAQFLADAIAGQAIGHLKPSYAHQRAESARRLAKRQEVIP